MMKKILLFLFCYCSFAASFALNAPELRCLDVDANGGITLTWDTPSDLWDFDHFEIYYAIDRNSTFSRIKVIMENWITSYHDPYPNALNQSACYFISAYTSNGIAYTSDTLTTIELYISNFGNGTAQLSWQPPITPPLPTYNTSYDIFKEFPAGTWNFVGNSSTMNYRDTIDVCDGIVGYRVELLDASGCKNVSRPVRDRFYDMISPAIPVFDSVSVDWYDNSIHLGWEPSTSGDASSYIIYYFENNIWVPVDTVWGHYNTTWSTTLHDPEAQIHHYRIAAMDSCLNASPMSEEQYNMQTSSQFDACTKRAYITWTDYINMPNDIYQYNIYYTVNGGEWTFAGTASPNYSSFAFDNLVPNSDYCFLVQAVNPFGTAHASSTKTCFTFMQGENHDFVYVRHVSVTDNEDDELEIAVSTGPTIAFRKVHLYKSIDSGQTWQFFKTLYNNNTSDYVFKDKDVKVHKRLYFYKAELENDCDMITAESNIAHNIVLKGNSANYHDYLNWNAYGDWENGVMAYNVQRHNSKETEFEDVGHTGENELDYEDYVFNFPEGGDRFIYRIEAIANPDSYGFDDISVSNQVVLYQEPIVYIANAFKPQASVTPIFKPSTSFVNLTDYEFAIYSRDGKLVFYTTNPEEGWDGKYKDGYFNCNVYVYKVAFSYGKDDYYEKVGTVTLVR